MFELAAQGRSQRAIAAEVFGDARYRGRMERILGSPIRPAEAAAGERVDLQALLPDDVEAPELRGLLEIYERILERREAEPSLAEIERLLRIHQRLEGVAQVERLNALTRVDPDPDEGTAMSG